MSSGVTRRLVRVLLSVVPQSITFADPEFLEEQLEQGFTTFCVKPSQFIDSAEAMPGFLREVMRRAEGFAR